MIRLSRNTQIRVMDESYASCSSFISEHNQSLLYSNLVECLNCTVFLSLWQPYKRSLTYWKLVVGGPDKKAKFIATTMEKKILTLIDCTEWRGRKKTYEKEGNFNDKQKNCTEYFLSQQDKGRQHGSLWDVFWWHREVVRV